MSPDPASRTPVKRRLGLPKSARVVHRRDFLRVREEGRRVVAGTVVVNWLECSPGSPAPSTPRLGVITTKALGSAVVRNRARRRMREAFRQLRPSLKLPAWVILIARHSMKDASAERVLSDIASGLRKARLLPTG